MIQKIRGVVIKGNQIGRTIGFPTANINLEKDLISDGTYKINIIIEGKIYAGAGSANNTKALFESFIFDFNESIYDKEIEVIILEKIRENRTFTNFEELKNQIKSDIKEIKEKNNYVLTFGTFDLVHEGHKYFLNEAKKYGNILVTILATDKNIEKFKGKKPLYTIEERISHIKELRISDIVSTGDEEDPLKWIDMYMPSVICLGYDQKGFSNDLENYLKENNLDIEIIRIEPYKEDIYKSSLLKEKIIK
ncbi:adenylyltransferase/cytidyltransferase family protein [Candidatus Gracilibacteria bacterium]|nr:adenylyltransferase/cytidyltransferase family protein [Candidatus Gracilibacteria bacterium]